MVSERRCNVKKWAIGAVIVVAVAVAGGVAYRNRERILGWALRPLGEVLTRPSLDRKEKYGAVIVEHWRQWDGNMACGKDYKWAKVTDSTGSVLVDCAHAVTVSPGGRWIVAAPKTEPHKYGDLRELILIDTRAASVRGRTVTKSTPHLLDRAQWFPADNLMVYPGPSSDSEVRVRCSEDGISILNEK